MLFGIIGGDRRQEELLALLRRDGYTVAACGVAGEMDWDAAVAAEVVILPLPLCKESCKQKSIAEMKKVPQNLHS